MVTQRTRCSRVYRVAPHEGSNPSTKARIFHQGRRDLRRTGSYDAENRTTKYDRKSQETGERYDSYVRNITHVRELSSMVEQVAVNHLIEVQFF